MNDNHERADIFDILVSQESLILDRLSSFVENYESFTNMSASDEIKGIFDSLRFHFEQQDELLSHVEHIELDRDLAPSIAAYRRNKEAIKEQIFHMTQLHVDEPGFKRYARELAARVAKLARLEETQLHKKLRKRLSTRRLEHCTDQLIEGLSS